ncbi:hypothetical protein EJ06DRAFT_518315 [Trichodelitschia bisporula]|uniref:RING-type domain-containing protein n=1 Tax=Trichodelitschia bisporula TaxID=703511 RepID=A0A6G1IB26_9PEZI|nr:hypothetical protein EJ06DRAFT_518315 [Trichodelitschia bisporula]
MDGMPHTRPKASSSDLAKARQPTRLTTDGMKSKTSSRDSLVSKAPKGRESPAFPNKDLDLLNLLKTEHDSIRSMVTCKICYGLLYEPYTTSCGHTYCYSCLCNSFGAPSSGGASGKSCPECRTTLDHAPAPSYLVRELTHHLIKKPELLPTGETLDQHAEWQKEQADMVQRDKTNTDRRNGGLFRGHFRRRMRPVHDAQDDVDRCPYCHWEVADGVCDHCRLPFDENGTGTWGMSDIDDTSEHDFSSEDFDAEMELEMDLDDDSQAFPEDAGEFEDFDWYGEFGSHAPFAMRRFLEGGVPPQGMRRRAAHSAAGSHRYSASVASELPELEEEDEEMDEDSSMNDFIDDGGTEVGSQSPASNTGFSVQSPGSSSQATWQTEEEDDDDDDDDEEDDVPISRVGARLRQNASRTPGPSQSSRASQNLQASQSSQPQANPFQNRRSRRVVSESPSDSTVSAVVEEEDDDDEGPIPAVRRNHQLRQRAQTPRMLQRVPSSISPREALQDHWRYTQLHGQGTQDDEMDEGDDSDTGTTVGWEPNLQSNDRARNAGSLTPTADSPHPDRRPASRTANADPNRVLRRRSSVLSTTQHYEDNDADDDTSDVDRDGDTNMNRTLRPRSSRIRLTPLSQPTPRVPPQNILDASDVDSDETDASTTQDPQGLPYNPRIFSMFAQYRNDLRDYSYPQETSGSHVDQLRRTPVQRPRTVNRNRMNGANTPQGIASPVAMSRAAQQAMNSPARLRTPHMGMDGAGQSSPNARHNLERPNPNAGIPTSGGVMLNGSGGRTSGGPSTNGQATAGAPAPVPAPAPANRLPSSQPLPSPVFPTPSVHAATGIERPQSRLNRPPSAGGRRGSGQWPMFTPPAPLPNMMGPPGLGFGSARTAFQTRNPFINHQMRPRPSTQRLREQSSTATLRPRSSNRNIRGQPSQVGLRDAVPPQSPQVRPQPSRIQLRSSPRALWDNENSQPAQATQAAAEPQPPTGSIAANPTGSNLSHDERVRRARELVERRREELAMGAGPARSNPFAGGRTGLTSNPALQSLRGATTQQAPESQDTTRFTTVGAGGQPRSVFSPVYPGLSRRRSNRGFNNPSPGAYLSSNLNHLGGPQVNTQRPRSGQFQAMEPGIQTTMARGVTQMTTAGDYRRN